MDRMGAEVRNVGRRRRVERRAPQGMVVRSILGGGRRIVEIAPGCFEVALYKYNWYSAADNQFSPRISSS